MITSKHDKTSAFTPAGPQPPFGQSQARLDSLLEAPAIPRKALFKLGFAGLALVACSPPEAPDNLDALGSFIFDHADDEDDEVLAKGVENLQIWLDEHRESVGDGVVIDNLDPAVVERIEGEAHDVSQMLGVAFVKTYAHGLKRMYDVILPEEPEDRVDEEGRVSFKRTYLTDRECFVEDRCERHQYEVVAINNYPLGLEANVHYTADLRWLDTPAGRTVVLRNWFVGPSTFNWGWLEVPLSYYLSVAVETSPGCVERTEVTWILANFLGAPVPIDVGLSLAIDTVIKNANGLEHSLDNKFGGPENPDG